MSTPFPGAPFALEQVRQLSVAALRVTYTQYPRAVDEDNSDDALNPDNYTLQGPQENYVVGAATVDGDRQSIDLYLAAPLDIGAWQLHAANVVEDSSEALMPPTTLPFIVTFTLTEDPLGHGAQNDETSNILRKYLNPALKGQGWNSMIAGISAGDQRNWDNARLAFNQLFLSTANGPYLDRRASDEGIDRPKGVNMSDALFRKLAIVEKTNKLTQLAVLEVLEVFYGRDTVRAYSDSTAELYALQDEDDLKILLDERKTVTVIFEREHFSRIGRATAQEVAAVITRSIREQGNDGFAVAVTNPSTNTSFVRIYSGTLGLTSSVRIVGGRGNTALLFPTSLFTPSVPSPFATWDATLSPTTQGNLRFTMTAGTQYDLFQVQEGDLAYIYGDEFEPCNTNGTFEVKAVSITYPGPVQWFEIENVNGVAHAGMVQVQFEDLMFFRPTRKTIYDNPRHVIVCENDDHLDVVIPATTEIVDRGPGLAAYLNGQDPVGVTSVVRRRDGVTTVTCALPHGLSVGDQVIIDKFFPTGESPATASGTPSGNFAGADDNQSGTSNASAQSTASQTGTYEGVFSRAIRTPEGRLLIVGGATTPDSITFTAKNNVTAFEVTSDTELSPDQRQVAYKWTQVSNSGTHGFSGNHFGQRYFGCSLLRDGRVLCTGGSDHDDATGPAINGYDLLQFLPPNAVSQQFGTLPAVRASHSQCSLADGRALLSGGYTVVGTALATALIFNPVTVAFTATSGMKQARMHHGSVELNAGHVLVAGGNTSAVTLNHCETYDVGGNTWARVGNMTYARRDFGMVKIPDGRVIVVGGRGYNPTRTTSPGTLATCEIYDPNTRLWAMLPSMPAGRENPVCEYVASENAIYVAGGANGLFSIDVFDVATMKWRRSGAQLPYAHLVPTGGLAGNDVFVVVGGLNVVETEKKNAVVIPGSDVLWTGAGINAHHTVQEVPDGTHFVVYTREYPYGLTYNVDTGISTFTKKAALAAPAGVPGPFSYDPQTGLAISATFAITDDTFNRDGHYSSVHLTGVNPALAFPDEEGFIVFNFGFKDQVGPVRYVGRQGDEELALDPSVPFLHSVAPGSTVRLLSGREPFQPAPDALVGNFYATGTAAGRVAAQTTISDIVAAGKQILVTVIYPGDNGLGAQGFPQSGNYKLSDKVAVWGGDELDDEISATRLGP